MEGTDLEVTLLYAVCEPVTTATCYAKVFANACPLLGKEYRVMNLRDLGYHA